jgi:hypothetical protein
MHTTSVSNFRTRPPFLVSNPYHNSCHSKVAANDMVNDANYKLLRYAHRAGRPAPGEVSAVVDFAGHLLTLLGYAPRTRMVHTRADILLSICGEDHYARTDACIVDSDDRVLLLIQVDKQYTKPKDPQDPEPQLIAGAIAAFQSNNDRGLRDFLHQDPTIHKVIPGIALTGTSPIFYKIPITTKLAQCVELGVYPVEPTIVHAYLPRIARPACRLSEGIEPLDNRATILSCYEAFKRFVN